MFARARKMAGLQRANHPWLGMDDLELLKSAQLYQNDLISGQERLTLAGILLFGRDQSILSAIPHHRTDLILRKADLDRYDDRDNVRTNLIEYTIPEQADSRLQKYRLTEAGKHIINPAAE